MKTLSETWFADGYIDFELKKYTLLAYLQEINRYFNDHKLYPQLDDISFPAVHVFCTHAAVFFIALFEEAQAVLIDLCFSFSSVIQEEVAFL